MNLLRFLLNEVIAWVEAIFIKNVPGQVGIFIRNIYWSLRFKKRLHVQIDTGCIISGIKNISIGKDMMLMHDSALYAENSARLIIGDRFNLNCRVMIDASDNGEIIIGRDVSIGPNVVMRASNHGYKSKDLPINKQEHTGGKIVIGNDVWIGSNCTILAGAVIGEGSVIGAGAVVNKEIPPYSLAGGVPARVIKENCRQ